MKLATKFIHAGAEPDPSTGAIMTPIYQTSTYVQSAPGKHKGYEYARSQNPTRKALEDAYACIENAKFALAFGSGVAATDSVMKLLNPGDEVIAANDMYGGTYRLFTKVWERFGIRFIYVDTTHADNIKQAVTANTKLIWLETPTNPLMNITDIA
ncbi:MAG TPA: PLP-dependent transferase, partial [Ferruginibacter sp.]|nr:PLP-dependent transferase [Ferruginibacter sp.]